MKPNHKIAVGMLSGIALGALVVQALYAQTKPPVYMVAINEITDQEGYTKQYLPTAQRTITGLPRSLQSMRSSAVRKILLRTQFALEDEIRSFASSTCDRHVNAV